LKSLCASGRNEGKDISQEQDAYGNHSASTTHLAEASVTAFLRKIISHLIILYQILKDGYASRHVHKYLIFRTKEASTTYLLEEDAVI